MPDFLGLGKLRSGNDTKATAAGSSPAKKDPNAPQPTPLERMLENAGPIRNDGSDKFFGMENFGNTCYCNSILQCLYYTPRFRENVLAYPHRSTADSLAKAIATVPPRQPYKLQNGVLIKPGQPLPQSKVIAPVSQPGQKPEDKDSPEYKKKLALVAGPIVNMTYQNNTSYDMPESMFTSLKDVFEALVAEKTRTGIVSPTRFLEVLRRDNEMFRSAMHQDAHEFLNLVLNTVMESIEAHEKKLEDEEAASKGETDGTVERAENAVVSWPSVLPMPSNQSRTRWLREMFEGTLTSETRCLTCETTSHRDEPFLDLSVDLEQHSSVTSCLNRFSREEMLCERDKFHCDNCGGLQEAEKRMKIKRLPQILALHLKRFKYTEDLARLQKLFHKVVYPFHLRLFNTTDESDDPDRLYELYAVVVHIGGGPYHGHYVAIIKTQDRGWLLFDDEMVEPVDRSYIQNFFGSPTGLACAYVLFYRQTTDEEVLQEQNINGKRRASQDLVPEHVINPAEQAAQIHRVHSADVSPSPLDTGPFASLDHAITAPPLSPLSANGNMDIPKSPYGILSPGGLLSPSKKEKSKEEKERKAAEKAAEREREKAEKQRKKELEQKLKDAQKRQNEELKAANEANKQSKSDDERRNGTTDVVETNGLAGRDIFKRSKSLRFGSLGRKDKTGLTAPSSTDGSSTTTSSDPSAAPTNGSTNSSAVDDSIEGNPADKDKEKKNRFSLRKKSFGLLS